ncbi:unnamed protein product [Owenia fusiformis]|uniref:Uncharacterized protein n=1 Tax=Owenia fusiformis TaxID=6347 RepID=A0A8J1U4D1_OWEFU|nr:unnamed protein product [Owenia fusiformis]
MTGAASAIEAVEDQIRTTAQTKRIRASGFFLDHDRLRSGCVTETQFFRVLWQNLEVKLTNEQEALLAQKYKLKRNGTEYMNYKAFCDVIERPFDAGDMSMNPVTQKVEPQEFLGTMRSIRPLSPASEKRIENLLERMQQFYKYHGINLRTSYRDFDRHHIGVVTESQFYRNFPGPDDVDEKEVHLLVRKYQDPDRPGLLNYLNLHHDLVAIGQRMDAPDTSLPQTSNISDFITATPGADATFQAIFDRIMVAVYKHGVRTIEFFKDHDKLKSGVITENQFVCGLTLAIGKEAQLTRNEIQRVAEFYKNPDTRIRYKEFCDAMENAFNVPDLEKKPLQEVSRPPRGALSRTLAPLTEAEEARLNQVLQTLSDQVRKRRLMMYQYFKDYDRGKNYTRIVTKPQFARILHFLSLNVSAEDMKLLCRKFEDPYSSDVNYPAFVQSVDQEYVGFTMHPPEKESILTPQDRAPKPEEKIDYSDISFDDLMARIRDHVSKNRLRVNEYFQDYDPLRNGSISKQQFRRGLGLLGLSKLGQHDLDSKQFQALQDYYQNPVKADQVLWTKFLWDIESVFTQPNLEKDPCLQVPPQEIFRVPKPGTIKWENASDDHKDLFESVMERLRQRANQRRVLAKPVFQDFDKHNNGHVTRVQFRQCLTMLELHATEGEMAALEAKFCNDTGFNYIGFLEELQPSVTPEFMYSKRLSELRLANQKKKGSLPELNAAGDLEAILSKIKTKVCKERIRVLEFMKDYDKLRMGRMLKASFRRALDLCRFELKESEIAILEDRYQSQGDSDYVEYLRFSDEIESIFTTKNLEKAPLLTVEQFKPPVEWEQNNLDPDAEELISSCMRRIGEKVRKHRMQLFPLFEDYDRVHNGTVSRSQFRRVLSELELGSLVNEQEFGLLYKKFDVKVGGKDDVNYIAFCDLIYELAHFEWRKP